MRAVARRKISFAQKARWAKLKATPRRTMSTAGRRGESQPHSERAGRGPRRSRRRPRSRYSGRIAQVVKITLEGALSLLSKYVEERTPVLAVFVTPSLSVARVPGTIRVSIVDRTPPHLIVGEDDGESDQIKFRLSDCKFEYGDFREAGAEDFGAHRFEGFLAVASRKGDTLSLFEQKS